MGANFANTGANSRKILQKIIDVLFDAGELSTVQISEATGLHAGVVGAILTRSAWATRRRVVRINRNKRETRWTASDAAMVDYARRNARCLMRKAALLASKGIEIDSSRGRIQVRCGCVTKIIHSD